MANPSARTTPGAASTVRLSFGQLLNVPNILTLCRIFSIPVFLAMVSAHHYRYALYLFAGAALTDSLDGTFARWFDARTEVGAFLDPFADKLMLLSAFIALSFQNAIPAWLLGVVIIRDVVIVFGYFMVTFLTNERIPVRPSYLGKISTFLQLCCVVAALAGMSVSGPLYWSGLLYLTLVVTGLSGLQYAYRGLLILSSREPEMFA